MRPLADENIPRETICALRAAGHDVVSASEVEPGVPDSRHVARAIPEERLIVTFDRDFGELALRGEHRPRAGVLLLRLIPKHADEITGLLVPLLARTGLTWRDHVSVVDGTHLRQRPF